MPFTNVFNKQVMNNLFGNGTYTSVTPLYFALGLDTTTPDGTGANGTTGFTEVSGGSYARVSVASNTTSFGALVTSSASQSISRSNAISISFPQATATWGTVKFVGVFDSATGGNMLAYGQLSATNNISSGDTASFAASSLTFTLA